MHYEIVFYILLIRINNPFEEVRTIPLEVFSS